MDDRFFLYLALNTPHAKLELYDLNVDIGGQHDVAAEHPALVQAINQGMEMSHSEHDGQVTPTRSGSCGQKVSAPFFREQGPRDRPWFEGNQRPDEGSGEVCHR